MLLEVRQRGEKFKSNRGRDRESNSETGHAVCACFIIAATSHTSHTAPCASRAAAQVENNSTAEFSAVNLVLKRSVVLSGGGAVQRLEDDAAKISTGGERQTEL